MKKSKGMKNKNSVNVGRTINLFGCTGGQSLSHHRSTSAFVIIAGWQGRLSLSVDGDKCAVDNFIGEVLLNF